MNLVKKLAGWAAVTMLALTAPATADISDFVGQWRNVNSHDRGVIRVNVTLLGNTVRVQVWGNCVPAACDWGTVNATVFGRTPQSQLPERATLLLAQYNQGFARRYVIIHDAGSQIRVDVLTDYTDNRSNMFDSDQFARINDPWPPGPGPGPLVEDCVGFNWAGVDARLVQGSWKLVDGNHWILDFGNKAAEAQRAENIVKHYHFNKQCFVGRPNPSFTYWLSGNHAASGGIPGEDCVHFNPHNVDARFVNGQWLVVDGNHSLFSFPNKAEAEQTEKIIKHYGFDNSCFIGRPGPSMTYQRK